MMDKLVLMATALYVLVPACVSLEVTTSLTTPWEHTQACVIQH